MNLIESKNWLRKYLLAQRRGLSAAARKRKSQIIARKIVGSRYFKQANVIAVFVSYGTEVDTRDIVEAAWRQRKTVLIPVSAHGFHKPYFVEYKSIDKIRKMHHGPFELIEKRKPFPMSKIDLMLVPGLGFDQQRHRLGFGGGVYDRIIAQTKAKPVGVFFEEQRVGTLPRGRHDRVLSAIVTDKN